MLSHRSTPSKAVLSCIPAGGHVWDICLVFFKRRSTRINILIYKIKIIQSIMLILSNNRQLDFYLNGSFIGNNTNGNY